MTPIGLGLNAVIGPLSAAVRKWLQLRLFHFLATQDPGPAIWKKEEGEVGVQWRRRGGGSLCITCTPQYHQNRDLMTAELCKIKQTWGGGRSLARQPAEKWKHMCVRAQISFFFFFACLFFCWFCDWKYRLEPSGTTGRSGQEAPQGRQTSAPSPKGEGRWVWGKRRVAVVVGVGQGRS